MLFFFNLLVKLEKKKKNSCCSSLIPAGSLTAKPVSRPACQLAANDAPHNNGRFMASCCCSANRLRVTPQKNPGLPLRSRPAQQCERQITFGRLTRHTLNGANLSSHFLALTQISVWFTHALSFGFLANAKSCDEDGCVMTRGGGRGACTLLAKVKAVRLWFKTKLRA